VKGKDDGWYTVSLLINAHEQIGSIFPEIGCNCADDSILNASVEQINHIKVASIILYFAAYNYW